MEFDIHIDQHTYHFQSFGEGAYPILFFHGMQQSSGSFAELMQSIPECTIYCIDLPFHGRTTFKNKRWVVNDIRQLIDEFCKKINSNRIGLAGFSIGARIALKMFEISPQEKITGLYLLAPDGIKINHSYRFLTQYNFNRKILRFFLARPHIITRFSHFLHKLKSLPSETLKSIELTMNDSQKIMRLQKFWIASAGLLPNKKIIISKINQHNIPTYIFIGIKDKLIPAEEIKNFFSKIVISQSGIYELNISHHFTHAHSIQLLRNCIKNNIISQCFKSI